MVPGAKLSIKFRDADAFAKVCMALRNDGVAFSLAGFHTVVLAVRDFQNLPEVSLTLLNSYRGESAVEISPVFRHGKRSALPSAREAEALLRELSETLCR